LATKPIEVSMPTEVNQFFYKIGITIVSDVNSQNIYYNRQ
jgi:hypothetical protein